MKNTVLASAVETNKPFPPTNYILSRLFHLASVLLPLKLKCPLILHSGKNRAGQINTQRVNTDDADDYVSC